MKAWCGENFLQQKCPQRCDAGRGVLLVLFKIGLVSVCRIPGLAGSEEGKLVPALWRDEIHAGEGLSLLWRRFQMGGWVQSPQMSEDQCPGLRHCGVTADLSHLRSKFDKPLPNNMTLQPHLGSKCGIKYLAEPRPGSLDQHPRAACGGC